MGNLLSKEQIKKYDDDGYVTPINVLSDEEIDECLTEINRFEIATGKQIDFPYKSRPHQVFTWADKLVHHPAILDAVEDVIGPDILCYHATLWIKPPQSNAFVRWHQDGAYFFSLILLCMSPRG